MTIAELPQQAMGAGHLWGSEFRQPSLLTRLWRSITKRRIQQPASEAARIARPPRRDDAERAASAVTDSLPIQLVKKPLPPDRRRNAALESLAGDALAARFHAWRGNSGQRYICSVFPVTTDPDAGLPDFTEAVVIAAACEDDGARRLVALRQCERGANPYARESFIIEALAAGASEWHIHLLASKEMQRRAAIADIDAVPRSWGACGHMVAVA